MEEVLLTIFIVGIYIYFRTRKPLDDREVLYRHIIKYGCTECDSVSLTIDKAIKETMNIQCCQCGQHFTLNPGLHYAVRGEL